MTVASVSGTPTTAGGASGLSSVNHQGGAGSGNPGDYFITTINTEDGSAGSPPDLQAAGYTPIAASAGSANAFPGSVFYGRGTYRARTGGEGATIALSGTTGLWAYASDIRILNAGGTFGMSAYDTVETGTTIDIPSTTLDAASDNVLGIAHIIDYDGGATINNQDGWTNIMNTAGAAFLFTKTFTQGAATGIQSIAATASRTRFGGFIIFVYPVAAGGGTVAPGLRSRRSGLVYR